MEQIKEINKLKININELKNSISDEYTKVVCDRNHVIHFISGAPLAERLGYEKEITGRLPEEAVRPFAGVGNPFRIGPIKKEDTILDIGSGAGMDCLVASVYTQHQARIYGMDMTPAMIEKARRNAGYMGLENIRFISGQAEEIPFEDDTFDLVISNGVINLCVDKAGVYNEIFRILKPGGRFQIADVALERPVPIESRNLVHLWTNCVAGAIPVAEYLEIIKGAGFSNVKTMQSYDVFRDARVAKSAEYFGAKGHNFYGIKI